MLKLTEITNHYCATGEWKIPDPERSLDDRKFIKRQDGLYIWLHLEKDKLVAEIHDLDAKISISLKKPVETIIKEIDTRLIESKSDAWANLLQEREQERLFKEQQKTIIEHLCKVAGAKPPSHDYTTFNAPTYSTGVNLNRCQVNSDNVYLTLRNVPFDLAEKIILLIQGKL